MADDAYNMIDRFLRNNLSSDADYARYSAALDSIYTAPSQRASTPKGWELLPEDETYAMHVAVMEVLYQKGVTRTTTHLLWQAYRRTLIESIAATNSHQDAEVNLAGWVREWEGDDSDVGQWLFAATEEQKDDSPNWQPVYWRSNIIPPGYVLVSEQKLKQLKASVSGECYQGELWELETLSDMIKNG